MLYRAFMSFAEIGSWTFGAWVGFAIAAILIGGSIVAKSGVLLRAILFIPICLEIYFLTPGFACTRSNFFTRAQGTQEACSDSGYSKYLDLNFGLNHWYMYVAYAGVVLFMLWPRLRPYRTDKSTIARNYQADAEATAANKRIDNIKRTGSM